MTADRQVQVSVIRADKLIGSSNLMCMILYGSLTIQVNLANRSILHRVTRSPEQASMQQVKGLLPAMQVKVKAKSHRRVMGITGIG